MPLIKRRRTVAPPVTATSQKPQTLYDAGIRNILIVYNPRPFYLRSRFGFNNALDAQMDTHHWRRYELATSVDAEQTIRDIISEYRRIETIQPGTVIVAISGDGTYNTILQAAGQLHGAPVILIAAGNKCDLAHLLNSKETLIHPEKLLEMPVVKRPIYPLHITISPTNNDSAQPTHHLIAYQSYSEGFSGMVASHIQAEKHRNHPLRNIIGRASFDWLTSIRLAFYNKVPKFTLNTSDKTVGVIEYMVVNTHRMAGMFYPDVDFDKRAARVLISTSIFRASLTSCKMVGGVSVGKSLAETEQHQVQAAHGIYCQVDGEPFYIHGTDLTITLSKVAKTEPVPYLVSLPPGYTEARSNLNYHPELTGEQKATVVAALQRTKNP